MSAPAIVANEAGEETAESYSARFQTLLSTLNASIASATKAAELPTLRTSLAELRSLVAGGGRWWVGYEMRRAQEEVHSTADALDAVDRKLHPRKRFQFGKRVKKAPVQHDLNMKKEESIERVKAKIEASQSSQPASGLSCVEINASTVEGSSGTVIYRRGSLQGRDVLIHDLYNAKVIILDVVGAVRTKNLQKCEVVACAVAGSVHVTGAKECKFWMNCRQMRIHESSNTSFFLDVKGKPIVESCEGLLFGEGRIQSDETGQLVEAAGLDGQNRWHEVQDFSWLHEGQSPNWALVEAGGKVRVAADGVLKVMI